MVGSQHDEGDWRISAFAPACFLFMRAREAQEGAIYAEAKMMMR